MHSVVSPTCSCISLFINLSLRPPAGRNLFTPKSDLLLKRSRRAYMFVRDKASSAAQPKISSWRDLEGKNTQVSLKLNVRRNSRLTFRKKCSGGPSKITTAGHNFIFVIFSPVAL